MKILVTGGGTGGHIYPALSIVKKLKEKIDNVEILYVGTKNGLESDIVPKENIPFKTVRVKGFRRKFSIDTFKSIIELLKGIMDSNRILNEYKPDFVIGTGGYVCGPVVFLASLKKIPTLIHEQNAFPGITNRILSRFVGIVAISFEGTEKYFKKPDRVVLTGNPINEDYLKKDRNETIEKLGLEKNKKIVLSFGGSGGQKSLNKSIFKIINDKEKLDMQLIHITGKNFYEEFNKNVNKDKYGKDLRLFNYSYDIMNYMVAADLIITSAGAITISEITAIGKPSIIVPKSNTAENHQEYNGRELEKNGAAVIILEKDLDQDILFEKLKELLIDDEKRKEMSYNSEKYGIKDASSRIIDKIINYKKIKL